MLRALNCMLVSLLNLLAISFNHSGTSLILSPEASVLCLFLAFNFKLNHLSSAWEKVVYEDFAVDSLPRVVEGSIQLHIHFAMFVLVLGA